MVRDIIQRAMLEKQPYEYRARFTLPDGREHLLYTRAKVILNSENQVVRRFGVTQDITEKVQTEQRLSTTEERYRDLVENSTDLICTHDLHGRLLSMNDRPARLLGYRSEDLIGRQIPDMLCLSIATSSLPTSPPSAAKVTSKVSSPFTPMPANAAFGNIATP
jgi:PAS domain-containing protein